MKKYIGILVLFGVLLVPSLSFAVETATSNKSDASCMTITHNLYLGSRDADTGKDVTLLQNFLAKKGYFKYGVTGNFGNFTKDAVIAFQKANKISNTGNVGIKTLAKINAVICETKADNTTANTTAKQTEPAKGSSVTLYFNNVGEIHTEISSNIKFKVEGLTKDNLKLIITQTKTKETKTITFVKGQEDSVFGYTLTLTEIVPQAIMEIVKK